MSPHQRLLSPEASAVKSRLTLSALAAAAGSGTVVFFHRFAARPRRPDCRMSQATRLRECLLPFGFELCVDPRGPVTAFRVLVDGLDPGGQLGIALLPARGPAVSRSVAGGTGDLQQLARPLDVAALRLLRLDEGIQPHRVSFAKKAVARFRMSTSSRSLRFSLRNSASSRRSSLVRPPSSLVPASRSACFTHSRTAVSVRSKSFATWPTDRSPRWHSSTISALNSAVNERRRRGCPMPSMIGHPLGAEPLMVDVRQNGSGSQKGVLSSPVPARLHRSSPQQS